MNESNKNQSHTHCHTMAIVTARRLLICAGFITSLVIIYEIIPSWIAAWPTLIITAAYLGNWWATLITIKLPKTYIEDINKKAIFITGCDSGFGLKCAQKLHALGITVFASTLSENSEGAIELGNLKSPRMIIIPMDVRKEEDVKRAYEIVNSNLGDKKLHAIVNNAGISAWIEVEWCPLETYRNILEVNALGPIRVTKTFLPLLRASQGRVVIVASLAGRYSFPGFTAYSMSKSAAVSFADGLRREMIKWSISVHTIEPTLYRTPIAGRERLQGQLQHHWDHIPDTIKTSYGQEYFEEFKGKLSHLLKNAKPSSKITEVVDCMIDASISSEPQMRYIPSVVTQLRAQVITAMPAQVQDFILCKAQPTTPPAAVTKRRAALRRLSGDDKKIRTLPRLSSVPSWFMRRNSSENQFVFLPSQEKINNEKETTKNGGQNNIKPVDKNELETLNLQKIEKNIPAEVEQTCIKTEE